MSDIVQDEKHARLVTGPHYRNGSISAGEKEVFFQSEHFGDIGVNYAAMSEDKDTLPNMALGDFVDGANHTFAKCFGGFAIFNHVPVARAACLAHNLGLTGGQRLREHIQIIALFDGGNGKDMAQPDLPDLFDNHRRQAKMLDQGSRRFATTAQRAAIHRIKRETFQPPGQSSRLPATLLAQWQVVINAAGDNFVRLWNGVCVPD